MTIPEFLETLRHTAPQARWTAYALLALNPTYRGIRTVTDCLLFSQCPLAFVGNTSSIGAFTAGRKMGLADEAIHAIMCAADGDPCRDRILYYQLLDAVGL